MSLSATMARESDTAPLRPNNTARPSSHLIVNKDGRKPLFGGQQQPGHERKASVNEGLDRLRTASANQAPGRRTNSESRINYTSPRGGRLATSNGNANGNNNGNENDSNVSSPKSIGSNPRIPKLHAQPFSNRRQLSLADAWEMAGDEKKNGAAGGLASPEMHGDEPMDASPSPAPRAWRSGANTPADENKLRDRLSKDYLDTKGWSAYAAADKGYEMGEPELPDLVPGIEDMALPSIEEGGRAMRSSPRKGFPSPEKSFDWQVDQDFTAGDLQISDSPRIRVDSRPFANRLTFDDSSNLDIHSKGRVNPPGSVNTKLDEIYRREQRVIEGDESPSKSTTRPRNTKLDDISAREKQVEHQIPLPGRHLSRLKNRKLDEIKKREEQGLSSRQEAAIKLEEIKEKNAMFRSRSPKKEDRPAASREPWYKDEAGGASPVSKTPGRARSTFDDAGQKIPDTPVTVYTSKNWRTRGRNGGDGKSDGVDAKANSGVGRQASNSSRPSGVSHSRAPSRELLRQLARAASSSPAPPETEAKTQSHKQPTPPKTLKSTTDKPVLGPVASSASASASAAASSQAATIRPTAPSFTPRPRNSRRATTAIAVGNGISQRNEDDRARKTQAKSALGPGGGGSSNSSTARQPGNPRPTVGFAGLRRSRSTDSTRSKKSSMNSDGDPTERIDAEARLFAPLDNYSERGSVRAPSPAPSDEDGGDFDDAFPEETPRAKKPDPLLMPTPRVTGAFVETPATLRVQSFGKSKNDNDDDTRSEGDNKPVNLDSAAALRAKKPDLAWRSRKTDTASDPGAGDPEDDGVVGELHRTDSTLAAARRRRGRSLPRHRAPVRNSAKPLSVKDDLLELRRSYNIEDSTWEDLGDFLAASKGTPLIKQEISAADLELSLSDDEEKLGGETAKSQPPTKPAKVNGEMRRKQRSSSETELEAYARMDKKLQRSLWGIHASKKGVGGLEDNVSRANKKARDSDKMQHQSPEDHHESTTATKVAQPGTTAVAYINLPVPRLYHQTPRFRLTLLGLLALILSLWYAAETGMCALYCRPTTCTSTPCVWSFDDPTGFGTAIPVKLDQWVTGGHGRATFNALRQDAEDWVADMLDAAAGRDIATVDMETLPFEKRREYRRRLRNKGLLRGSTGPALQPEQRRKWDSWRQARLAQERAREEREIGTASSWYGDTGDGGAIGGDERVW